LRQTANHWKCSARRTKLSGTQLSAICMWPSKLYTCMILLRNCAGNRQKSHKSWTLKCSQHRNVRSRTQTQEA
jgi:hypothetical protein